MATNADEVVVDDDKEVTEDDLRNLKYGDDGVETTEVEDDPTTTDEDAEESDETSEEDGQTDDQATEDEEQSDSTDFVKEFPNIKGDTPEEYAKNLEKAYQESTKEALRLKGIAEAPPTAPAATEEDDTTEVDLNDPLQLWAKQELDKSITTAYTAFSKEYPQVTEPAEYTKFTREVAALSATIMSSQKRLASPEELYSKAAVILGWEKNTEPTEKERLAMALKNANGSSKLPSGPGGKPSPKSKVTDSMIKINRMMYPGKTDDEIRKELEPYVN